MSNVKPYSNQEILQRIQAKAGGFTHFPNVYWLCCIRSNEDAFNRFDDKFYLFKGTNFIAVWEGTTNAGKVLLMPKNPKGVAILKADEIYYDSWQRGLHRGKVLAYKQRQALPVYRDNNRNSKSDEIGQLDIGYFGINLHPDSYIQGNRRKLEFIDFWSEGCLVFRVRSEFDEFMQLTQGQDLLTICLLKEF